MKTRRPPMSPGLRFRIWRRDGFRCTYCGISALDTAIVLEVDHIAAAADGGSDDPSNLTTACRPCNRRKGPRGVRQVREAGAPVSFLLTLKTLGEIDQIAAVTQKSRASVVRRLIAEALEARRLRADAEAV